MIINYKYDKLLPKKAIDVVIEDSKITEPIQEKNVKPVTTTIETEPKQESLNSNKNAPENLIQDNYNYVPNPKPIKIKTIKGENMYDTFEKRYSLSENIVRYLSFGHLFLMDDFYNMYQKASKWLFNKPEESSFCWTLSGNYEGTELCISRKYEEIKDEE